MSGINFQCFIVISKSFIVIAKFSIAVTQKVIRISAFRIVFNRFFQVNKIIDAIIYGSAVASYTVSQFSVEGLKNINFEGIHHRAEIISNLLAEKKSID